MDKIFITGGNALKGEIRASGSKNSALPLLFSSLLARGEHTFHNVPALKDIQTACLLLKHFGCVINREGGTLKIKTGVLKNLKAPYNLVRQMRASALSLGPLLGSEGFAEVSLPGGCAIGTRALDLHIKGFQQLGAHIALKNGLISARVPQTRAGHKLKGALILLDHPTVGGTQNLMMAACLAEGESIIENSAREPEIVDLAEYLCKMGADIKGAGTSLIRIKPKTPLKPSEHTVIPDRIEAGTLLLAGAITKGQVKVTHCVPSHLDALMLKLAEAGFVMERGKSFVKLASKKEILPTNIITAPYPGFPTDLQAQFMALMTQAKKGSASSITETIFENRFMHIQELARLGADIHLEHRTAMVKGGSCLQGAEVTATDLRASACLILAGLAGRGETTVHRVYHLDRGYECLEQKLSSLGADIKRGI